MTSQPFLPIPWRRLAPSFALLVGAALAPPLAPALLAAAHATPYAIGAPVTVDVWVDPLHGDDGASGATRAQALRSVTEAWRRIPLATPLATGYHLRLVAGTYDIADDAFPVYWESRWGSAEHPVIVEAADGVGSAVLLGNVNIFDCRYLYLIGLVVDAAGGDVLHIEGGHHYLLRGLTVDGAPAVTYDVQETVKVNQAQHVYIEECDVHGAWDNALDGVAVQFGHVIRSRFHDAGWCVYLKGGSASFVVEGNEVYDCGVGLVAGQGTGFEYLTAPWLHYEAYDLKYVNNVVHDTTGPGIGVYGAYNLLVAYNTLFRVGFDSHAVEFVRGSRSCDGDSFRCAAYLVAGGWGTAVVGEDAAQPIPNRNVYFLNNVVYNPPGSRSQWQHFTVFGPTTGAANSNLPNPVLADDRLVIRGNLIWNGPADLPLGIGEATGCQPANATCNAAQILADNTINTVEPALVDPAGGNFRPVAGGSVFAVPTVAVPDFPGGDRPQPPLAPAGDLDNAVPVDRDGVPRAASGPPGAHATDSGGSDGCATADGTLCLGARFAATTRWRTAGGTEGDGQAVSLAGDTGYFWFFAAANVELVVKVLDGCGVNGHYWVFAGGLTDVAVTTTVTDTVTGASRAYSNPQGTAFAPLQDTAAFAGCP